MAVGVTGGTGFVGSHTVAALAKAGHSVRLLVRSRERVGPALKPLGVEEPFIVEGDVTDQASVEKMLSGCNAVVHCASVYTLQPRQERAINVTNVRGTEIVLAAAAHRGCNPIVHVSSIYGLIGEPGATLTPDSAPGRPMGAYFRSKADSDAVARRFQSEGAPVVISYPGSVWGPQDPHFGETCILLRNILLGLGTVFPRGTWMISDVRDVARFHARLLGVRTHDRYFAPTTTVGVREVFSIIRDATGRRIPLLSVPEPLLRPGLLLGEAASRSLGLPMLWPVAGGWAVGLNSAADDSRTRREFGLDPTPLRDTVRDTIRWMASVGYVSARQAGALR